MPIRDWVRDIGEAAGATWDPQTGQPLYGATLDIGMASFPELDRETMLNSIRTSMDDQAAEARASGPWGSGTVGRGTSFLGNIGTFFSGLWRRVEEQPLNPINAPIKAVGTLAGSGAYLAGRAWDNSGADSALDGIVDAIMLGGRAAATPIAAGNIDRVRRGDQYSDDDGVTGPGQFTQGFVETLVGSIADLFTGGEAWEQAWASTDPEVTTETTSPGRATLDMFMLSNGLTSPTTADTISRGMLNPNDPDFIEYRQTSTPYNVASGVADFAYAWYLAPEVLALKATGAAWRTGGGRTTLMSAQQSQRFRDLALATDDEIADMGFRRTSLLDQSAMRARQRIADLRSSIQSGETTFEELSRMPFARHAAQGDSGAAAYVIERAARADDETWRMAVKASMGDEQMREALRYHADTEIADAIEAIHGHRVNMYEIMSDSLETEELWKARALEAHRAGDRKLAAEHRARAKAAATRRASASNAIDLGWRNEREYESLQVMLKKVAGDVWESSAPAGREGLLIDAPVAPRVNTRELVRRSYIWKPTRYGKERVISSVSMAWKKQPGVFDLHRGDNMIENATAYLDQIERYGNKALDETWTATRESLLRRMGGAMTDVERRALAKEMQNIGIERLAAAHGLDIQDAKALRVWLERKQGEAFGALSEEPGRRWTRAGLLDEETGETKYLDMIDTGDGLTATPISVTQLQNWFTAVDMRQLDRMLKIHGDDIRTRFSAARELGEKLTDVAVDVLDKYNHLWKFSVLFRLGYPIRTVTDDSMRAVAAAGGLGFILEQIHAPQIAQRAKRRAGRGAEIGAEKGTRAVADASNTKHLVSEALSGRENWVYRKLAGSEAAWGQFFDVYLDKFNKARVAKVKAVQYGKDYDYTKHWANLTSEQLLLDPVIGRMLDGVPDEEIARWLRTSDEGKDILKRLPGYVDGQVGDTVEEAVWRLREHLEYMAPGDFMDILRQARHGDIGDAKALRKAFEKKIEEMPEEARSALPVVDFATTGMITGLSPAAKVYTVATSSIFKVLQQLPNDTLVRNPFFRSNYTHRINEILGQFPTEEITEALIKRAQRDANEYALTRLRRYLFSLNEETELLHLLRHFVPFGTAHLEAMRKWAQVFLDNPVGVYRVWGQGWAGLGDLAFIDEVDREGNPVKPGNRWTTESYLRFRVPDTMVSLLPPLQAFYNAEGDVYAQISKGATNLLVQGDPFFVPSTGPVVQIPADWFFKRHPELSIEGAPTKGFYDWLFPIGAPQNSIDLLLPTSANKALQTSRTDPAFNATEAIIMKQVVANFRQVNGRDPNRREMAEIARRAEKQGSWIRRFYFLGSMILPANVYYLPGDQELIEQYRRLQREYGPTDGYARFVEEFGWEAAVLGQSMSTSTNNVPATGVGILEYGQWKKYIQDYPELGDIIVSPQAFQDDYEQSVYRYQQQQPTGPGRPEKQRSTKASTTVLEDASVRQGWQEYGEYQRWVREQLTARFGEGATLNRKGAEDLAFVLAEARSQIAERYPAWANAYGERDTRWGLEYLDSARSLLADLDSADPNFRVYAPWLGGLEQYINLHDWVAGELAARKQSGGSGTLDAQGNEDLAYVWDAGVAQITHQNPVFAEHVYDRKLENWKPEVLTP